MMSGKCTGCDETETGPPLYVLVCQCGLERLHQLEAAGNFVLNADLLRFNSKWALGRAPVIPSLILVSFAIYIVSVLIIIIKGNIIFVSSLCINIKHRVLAELCAVPAATFLFHLISCCFRSTYQCRSTGTLIFPFYICMLAKTSAEIICFTKSVSFADIKVLCFSWLWKGLILIEALGEFASVESQINEFPNNNAGLWFCVFCICSRVVKLAHSFLHWPQSKCFCSITDTDKPSANTTSQEVNSVCENPKMWNSHNRSSSKIYGSAAFLMNLTSNQALAHLTLFYIHWKNWKRGAWVNRCSCKERLNGLDGERQKAWMVRGRSVTGSWSAVVLRTLVKWTGWCWTLAKWTS